MKTFEEGVYYLFYKESKNPKNCHISIRYPGINSTPLVVIGGKRAKELFNFIIQLLDNNGIKYSVSQKRNLKIIELPLATGLSTSIFLLTTYSSLRPLKYASVFEKLILGKMPFMKYFITMGNLASDLSDYVWKDKTQVKQALDRKAARTVSRMLIQLIKGIEISKMNRNKK